MNLGKTTAPLGTYHLIDGVRIRINYRNCIQTCSRCYSTPDFCPGGVYGRKCYELGGQKIQLAEHIEWLVREHVRRKEILKNDTHKEIDIDEVSKKVSDKPHEVHKRDTETNEITNTVSRDTQRKITDMFRESERESSWGSSSVTLGSSWVTLESFWVTLGSSLVTH